LNTSVGVRLVDGDVPGRGVVGQLLAQVGGRPRGFHERLVVEDGPEGDHGVRNTVVEDMVVRLGAADRGRVRDVQCFQDHGEQVANVVVHAAPP
jgi:hypothetical protein